MPNDIGLEAWIYLAGPFKGHRAVVVGKKRKKKAMKKVIVTAPALPPEPMDDMRVSYQPPVRYGTKTTTDISADCLQLLIRNGYGKEQAGDLVKRCQDLKCTRYDNRDSMVRRLTLPGEPTHRCTSLKEWLRVMKEKHPPSISTGYL
jgi:hypothetical protein